MIIFWSEDLSVRRSKSTFLLESRPIVVVFLHQGENWNEQKNERKPVGNNWENQITPIVAKVSSFIKIQTND